MTETPFQTRLREILEAYALSGRRITVGVQQPLVYAKASADILLAANNVVPVDGTAGYAKGCYFIKTDAVGGVNGVYINVGTTASCLFWSVLRNQPVLLFSALPASAVAVHAAVQESDVNAFPGPFTNPTLPRSLDCVFDVGWQGGDVTVVGTDQFDQPVTEVYTAVAGTTVAGTKIFKTIVSASKAAQAGTTDTVQLQTGGKIGLSALPLDTVGLLFCDNASEAVVIDATVGAFTPTTAPNDAHDYKIVYNVL